MHGANLRKLKFYDSKNKITRLLGINSGITSFFKNSCLPFELFVFKLILLNFASKYELSLRGPKSPFLMVQNSIKMDLNKEVSKIVEDLIDNDEIFLVDVLVKGKSGSQKIQVFIDGDQAVDIDECSNISRKLAEVLEEREVIEGRYVIEVSSPGVDRPIKFIRQYPKHIGREIEVVTKEKKKYQGVLLDVTEDEIELSIKSGNLKKELKSDTLKLSFSNIDKTKVVLRF